MGFCSKSFLCLHLPLSVWRYWNLRLRSRFGGCDLWCCLWIIKYLTTAFVSGSELISSSYLLYYYDCVEKNNNVNINNNNNNVPSFELFTIIIFWASISFHFCFFFFFQLSLFGKFGLVDAEEENDKLARIEKSNCLVEINTPKYQLQSNIYGVGYVECGPSFDWTQCVAWEKKEKKKRIGNFRRSINLIAGYEATPKEINSSLLNSHVFFSHGI